MTYKEIAGEALTLLETLACYGCLIDEEEANVDRLISEFSMLQRGE